MKSRNFVDILDDPILSTVNDRNYNLERESHVSNENRIIYWDFKKIHLWFYYRNHKFFVKLITYTVKKEKTIATFAF